MSKEFAEYVRREAQVIRDFIDGKITESEMSKKLEEESKYNKFDLNNDGVVTDDEIAREREMMELELREEKSEAQKRMAWVAMGSMIIFSLGLFTPLVSESRVSALADLLGLFYIAQAGVVGAYMGVSAWMSRK